MKRVLYISNIEVPYRTLFFNGLAEKCDLTVLFERRKSANRDSKWSSSEDTHYNKEYLDGIKLGNENSFSFNILSWIRKDWDAIIIGCCNSKVQMMAMMFMRMAGIPFYLNLDGEQFISDSFKGWLKKAVLSGAKGYFSAGVKSAETLKNALGNSIKTYPYYFSSLTEKEILSNIDNTTQREDFVLVVGQYFEYKGMDIAFDVACADTSIKYKFVGMGNRTQLFIDEHPNISPNIQIIPFLQKKELEEEYKKCKLLLLPTRQECWGLVVNEAASFGTPIVSTWGSGAAVEFLAEKYSQYLATPGDCKSLFESVHKCLTSNNCDYCRYLCEISKMYNIENGVNAHIAAL